MQYVILSREAYEAYGLSKWHRLSEPEFEFLIAWRDILSKFFQIQQDTVKTKLGNGEYRDNEWKAYVQVEYLEFLKQQLDTMAKQVEAYEAAKKEQKKETKEKDIEEEMWFRKV